MRRQDGTVVASFWAEGREETVHLFLGHWREGERYSITAVCGYGGPRRLVPSPLLDRVKNRHPTPVFLCCEACLKYWEDVTGRLMT